MTIKDEMSMNEQKQVMPIDREAVIRELTQHIARADYIETVWMDCVSVPMLRGALELLKEQEPRVLTLEEVKGMKRLTVCAVEQRSKVIKNTFNAEYGGIVTIDNENFIDFGLYGDTNRYRRAEAGYGKTWRCWSSRPTDEQRKAVKWDE